MSLIIDTVQTHLPAKRKVTPSGWVSFNGVCCHHNGTSADTRQRGGINFSSDGVSYHCFNCGFKASWQPGRPITTKFKKFLQWLNVSDDLITKCSFEALRLKDDGDHSGYKSLVPTFIDKALPMGARPIKDLLDDPPEALIPVLEYMNSRGLYIDDFDWHWTEEDGFQNRLIVPFMYHNRCVGYTARLIRDGKPKYISEQQPGYVFNLDNQGYDRNFVVVCEGPFDAIGIDGVALLGAEIKAGQQILINQLQKQVIVIPDRDHEGPRTVEQAVNLGWGVSFPDWAPGIKDVNDAVQKYGRIYTLYSILQATETSALKIQLIAKNWFKDIK